MSDVEDIIEPIGWVKGSLIVVKRFSVILTWMANLVFLVGFWTIGISAYMNKDYLIEPYQGEEIRIIMRKCFTPSVEVFIRRVIIAIFFNLLFNLILRYGHLSRSSYDTLSSFTGCCLLAAAYSSNFLTMGFMILIHLLVERIKRLLNSGHEILKPLYITTFTLTLLFILGELYFPCPDVWQENRLIMTIMAMKIISLSFDQQVIRSITTDELLGYLFCPATVLFGPWISIRDYRTNYNDHSKLNWKWLFKIANILTSATILVTMANCFSRGVFLARNDPFGVKWLKAFGRAFMFRSSNYFICYMAEFTMITAGFNKLSGRAGGNWQYTVCHPLFVEFPRSIATLARNWNTPFYHFVQDCVSQRQSKDKRPDFQNTLGTTDTNLIGKTNCKTDEMIKRSESIMDYNVYTPYAEVKRGYAVLITYFVTATLLGMNIRTMAVLLSLEIISFNQLKIQEWLSDKFSSCCKVTPCNHECNHGRGRFHAITMIINAVSLFLNVFYLAYIGYIMDEKVEISSFMDLFMIWHEDFLFELGFYIYHVTLFLMSGMVLFAR